MTIGLELVTVRPWTDDELRGAVALAWAARGLGRPEVTGDVGTHRLVEIATDELDLQVFRPHRRTTLAGPRWVTAMAVAASSSDELVAAVLDVAADLARRCEGHLTVDGEVQELEGVPSPHPEVLTPAAPDPDADAAASPFAPVLAGVLLDAATPQEEGWRSLLGALGAWVGGRTDWRPRWWRPEEEWEPFDPDGPPPPWWPMEADLATGGGVAAWVVRGAGFPPDVCSQLDVQLRQPAGAAVDLLDGLARLGPWQPFYAVVHPWHDEEPFTGAGPRRYGAAGPPSLALSGELLADGLPNLYWGNLLGDPWVSAIGAERIASAPAYRVEEVLPGRWLVQLTEQPSDVLDDWEGFGVLREQVKEHLGADLFRQDDGLDRLAPRRLPLPTLGERGLVE